MTRHSRIDAPGSEQPARPPEEKDSDQPVVSTLGRVPDAAPGRGGGAGLVALARRVQASAGNHAFGRALARRAGVTPAGPTLARRLIAQGDIDRFQAIAEPGSGLQLAHDPVTNEITAVGTLATPATSPAFAAILTRIMNDPAQDAEAQFGAAQSVPFAGGTGGVLVGAFPDPRDMSTTTVQTIDLDDVENVEAGSPGHGLAFLAHELSENYEAHAHLPAAAGADLFPAAHQAGIVAENAVLADTVGPGGRVADRMAVGTTPGTLVFVFDYEHYFFVMDVTQAPNDNQVSGARSTGRTVVSTHAIDNFVTGGDAVPGGGAAAVAAALADLVAHTQSTATIEGFTDDVGTPAVNDPLSQRRADSVRAALVGAGGGALAGAMHSVGRGATRFVAGNATEADRARNRRVEITIAEPAP